ncbi:L-histidine N(alpha)-methyltransferase [Catellatospora tritici]|uniref:L-histidine N(alpha)-methyltransferase n=1 Tax=Catellatospora tritici TaxID=2851566 RepID=UPI001C2D5848|nr:L-histidine N(alpha)-methyltransferase [Catellatospora tritici]MBV1851711.1 L-histidine N(alpha)-methyltransferase [Catellatospora tritici]
MRIDVHLTPEDLTEQLRADARAGLTATPKWLPPKYFYDAYGSDLFERITALPEYYPTRAEREILTAHAADIARETGVKTLVELGSGSSDKTRLLLDALHAHGTLGRFVPLDVSQPALAAATEAIAADYSDIEVHAIVGDFTRDLDRIPGGGSRMVVFLGSTIGNLNPGERAAFLRELRGALEPGEWLLLGTDLVKDEQTLVAAYDDEQGITAEFNTNVLRVLNRSLGADFDLTAFDHVALWDAQHRWIEMRLRAQREMRVHLPALDLEIEFRPGEELRTEISAKFDRQSVATELAGAGFTMRQWWTDPQGRFGLSLSRTSERPTRH